MNAINIRQGRNLTYACMQAVEVLTAALQRRQQLLQYPRLNGNAIIDMCRGNFAQGRGTLCLGRLVQKSSVQALGMRRRDRSTSKQQGIPLGGPQLLLCCHQLLHEKRDIGLSDPRYCRSRFHTFACHLK